jgi:hypothetical protein
MMQKYAREIKRGPITIIWGLFAPLRNPILSASIACQEFLEDNLGAFRKSKHTPLATRAFTSGSQNIHLWKREQMPLEVKTYTSGSQNIHLSAIIFPPLKSG